MFSLNKFNDDSKEDISLIEKLCQKNRVSFAINDTYSKGSTGGIELAREVVKLCDKEKTITKLYADDKKIEEKIKILAKKIYHAKEVSYTSIALEKIKHLEKLHLDKYPICVSKTPMSISDNKELLGYPKDYTIYVTYIKLNNGAGFIVVYMGNVITLPGLSKNSNYLNMHIDDDGNIEGII